MEFGNERFKIGFHGWKVHRQASTSSISKDPIIVWNMSATSTKKNEWMPGPFRPAKSKSQRLPAHHRWRAVRNIHSFQTSCNSLPSRKAMTSTCAHLVATEACDKRSINFPTQLAKWAIPFEAHELKQATWHHKIKKLRQYVWADEDVNSLDIKLLRRTKLIFNQFWNLFNLFPVTAKIPHWFPHSEKVSPALPLPPHFLT